MGKVACRAVFGADWVMGCGDAGWAGGATTFVVEIRLKFVWRLAAGAGLGVALVKRTPMGFAALKVNPSAALNPTNTASCSAICRTSERAAGNAEMDGEPGVLFAGGVVAGALPRDGL